MLGNQQVPYTLFMLTVNSICLVICSTTTTIKPYEKMVLTALLDANAHYATNQTHFLEPTTLKASPILNARGVVNYTSVVVQLFITNISSAPVTIEKREMLVVDQFLEQHSFSDEPAERHGNNQTPVQEACDRADPALTREKKSALFALFNKHSEAFSAIAEDLGRTRFIYHTIDIGDSGPVRQGMRCIPHEQIVVLKAEVEKMQNARMVRALVFTVREPHYSGQNEGRKLASLHRLPLAQLGDKERRTPAASRRGYN